MNDYEARERLARLDTRIAQARHEEQRQRLERALSEGRADDLPFPRLLGHAVVAYLNVTEALIGEA